MNTANFTSIKNKVTMVYLSTTDTDWTKKKMNKKKNEIQIKEKEILSHIFIHSTQHT